MASDASSSDTLQPRGPGATGQSMPDLLQPLPDPPDRRVGFALVGLGAYALNQIAPNLAATRHARLAALVSGNAEKANDVAEAYGIGRDHVYSYDTFDRIAEDETVDVVYVVLPNAQHREWTERSFRAGKHVLCEKPMAGTVEDCEAMIGAAEEAERRLMIAYRAQFDPYNLKAIKLIREGAVGDVKLLSTEHGRPLDLSDPRDQWRARKDLALGGSLYDIGIYSVNGARYLTGEEPVEVTARYRPGSGRSEVTVEEGVEWTLLFPSGAIASSASSYLTASANRMTVEGTEGSLTLDPATSYYVRTLHVKTGDQRTEHTIPQANQFARMLDEMALAAREDREPKTSGMEGLRDIRIMQAIYRAAETGETVRLGGG